MAKPSPRLSSLKSKSAADAQLAALGGRVADRYTLREQLGSGAMGVVWLATDDRLQRQVAVKVLAASWADSASTRRRFEREARAVAQLRSPHIVEVYDYGIEQDCPFIVMELLDGEELTARLKRRKRLKLEEVGTIVLQTCRALHVAHQAGIVHRDLKPGNIMLDRSTGEEMVKVLDFGVAKRQADNRTDVTKDGMLIGTPQFMAPEQARAVRDLDGRADLWSLGVLVYRALTGRLPFRAKTVVEIIVELCTADVPKATELCPDLPPLIDGFFARALARDRDQRFGSAREFAGAYFRMLRRVGPTRVGTESGQFLAIQDGDEALDEASPVSDSSPSFPSDSGAFSLSESHPLAAPVGEAGSRPGVSTPGVTASQLTERPAVPGVDESSPGSASSLPSLDGSGAPPSISTQVGMVDDVVDDPRPHPARHKLLAAVAAVVVVVLAGGAYALLHDSTGQPGTHAAPTDGAIPTSPTSSRASVLPASAPSTTNSARPATSSTAQAVDEPTPTASATATAEVVAPAASGPVRRPPPARRPSVKPPPSQLPPAAGDEDLLSDRH